MNVEKLLELIPRIYHIKRNTGMKPASSATSVVPVWWTNSSDLKLTEFIVGLAMMPSLPPDVMDVVMSLRLE